MFDTSIHWTTFFYLLIDIFLLVFAYFQSTKLRHNNLKSYLILGVLFVLYNLTGGFLPLENFPGPFILQYVITYGVAITMCLYVVYFLYKEFDISFLRGHLTVFKISIFVTTCFLGLFLPAYFYTKSLEISRIFFALPVATICLYILWAFRKRVFRIHNSDKFILRRNRLSVISMTCIAMLPILTVIGDYQWLTFTVINLAFFSITAMEIDRYLYFLRHEDKLSDIFGHIKKNARLNSSLLNQGLTRREIEISMVILERKTYKEISDYFFIAESTVSKHASNIFKKIGVKNRTEFLSGFRPRKK